jgi:hypothetical protein
LIQHFVAVSLWDPIPIPAHTITCMTCLFRGIVNSTRLKCTILCNVINLIQSFSPLCGYFRATRLIQSDYLKPGGIKGLRTIAISNWTNYQLGWPMICWDKYRVEVGVFDTLAVVDCHRWRPKTDIWGLKWRANEREWLANKFDATQGSHRQRSYTSSIILIIQSHTLLNTIEKKAQGEGAYMVVGVIYMIYFMHKCKARRV